MTMSVVASILRAVGIRNSDLGLLELMWYPCATRNRSGTWPDLPWAIVTTAAGAMLTTGFMVGASCAEALVHRRTAKHARKRLIPLGYLTPCFDTSYFCACTGWLPVSASLM